MVVKDALNSTIISPQNKSTQTPQVNRMGIANTKKKKIEEDQNRQKSISNEVCLRCVDVCASTALTSFFFFYASKQAPRRAISKKKKTERGERERERGGRKGSYASNI